MPTPTIQAILGAAWWPELLAVKDTLSWAHLGERFGVDRNALRRALAHAGEVKRAQPPGRRARPSAQAAARIPAPRSARSPVEAFTHLLGTMPDAQVAALAGTSAAAVKLYRLRRGIPAAGGRRSPASASAPRPAVRASKPAPATAPTQGFRVHAAGPAGTRGFVVLAVDIAGAVRRTQAALDARADGPWVVEGVEHLGEGLV